MTTKPPPLSDLGLRDRLLVNKIIMTVDQDDIDAFRSMTKNASLDIFRNLFTFCGEKMNLASLLFMNKKYEYLRCFFENHARDGADDNLFKPAETRLKPSALARNCLEDFIRTKNSPSRAVLFEFLPSPPEKTITVDWEDFENALLFCAYKIIRQDVLPEKNSHSSFSGCFPKGIAENEYGNTALLSVIRQFDAYETARLSKESMMQNVLGKEAKENKPKII